MVCSYSREILSHLNPFDIMRRRFLLAALVGFGVLIVPPQEAVAQEAMEPIMYVTQYRIDEARLDSLTTLTAMFDVPWHNFLAERIDGYQRRYYRHDTGGDHNFVISTMYPDWDYVRGDEMDLDTHWEAFKQTEAYTDMESMYEDEDIEAMFNWAYAGSEHQDNIYRPITASE